MSNLKRVAIYPGTFDPITIGHMDIIRRAVKLVDTLIIAVAEDIPKTPIFSIEERTEMVKQEIQELNTNGYHVVAKNFKGLLVNFAQEQGANHIIRGLRAVSDFEYEFQMACMNSTLSPDVETLFLPASEHTQFISSRFVKEIARLGGDISHLVSANVSDKVMAVYS